MKTSPQNVAEIMMQSIKMSGVDLFNDINEMTFPSNNNNDPGEKWNEIDKILLLLCSKIQSCKTDSELEYKTLEDKCFSLEAKIQDLSKPCHQCIKYQQHIDNFAKKNESSNKVLFESDADSRSSPMKDVLLEVDMARIIRSLTPVKSPNEEKSNTSAARTPPTKRAERDTSPVVQKQQRSGKRTKLSISSKKKYRFEKDDGKVNPEQFSELPDTLFDANDERGNAVKVDQVENEPKTSLTSCITVSDETILSDSSIIEPSPAPVMRHRRTNKSNPFLNGKYNPFECVNDDATLTPLSANLLNDRSNQSSLLEKKSNQNDSSKPKWELKLSHGLNSKNSKYKQTTLSTVFSKKTVDISTSKKYKGGVASDVTLNAVPVDMELTVVNNASVNLLNNKENTPVGSHDSDDALQETIFYNETTKKKKPLTDPASKVNEIFFGINKSNNRNKYSKPLRDLSQETIFEEEEPREKKSPVAAIDTALQETFFQADKPNGEAKNEVRLDTAQQETYFSVQAHDELKSSSKSIDKLAFPLNKPNGIVANRTLLDTALQETFFNPPITSTVNQDEPEKKPSPKKFKPPPESPKNSFDYVPSPETPPYKYRRDALRKKADRQKLPGQECPTCLKFYLEDKDKVSDTQMALIRKCSRHRDKYPIYSNTPPGIWNPRFDETDESD